MAAKKTVAVVEEPIVPVAIVPVKPVRKVKKRKKKAVKKVVAPAFVEEVPVLPVAPRKPAKKTKADAIIEDIAAEIEVAEEAEAVATVVEKPSFWESLGVAQEGFFAVLFTMGGFGLCGALVAVDQSTYAYIAFAFGMVGLGLWSHVSSRIQIFKVSA